MKTFDHSSQISEVLFVIVLHLLFHFVEDVWQSVIPLLQMRPHLLRHRLQDAWNTNMRRLLARQLPGQEGMNENDRLKDDL